MQEKRTTTLLSVVVLSLVIILTASASAYTVSSGSMTTLDEVGDVDLAGNIVYAINCGQGLREGNPTANPYLTGNGNDWGSISDGQDLVVGSVTFLCDMWSMKDEARDYNRQGHDELTDYDLFGYEDTWRHLPERGSKNLGSDDGGILGFANYVSGWQTQNEKWQSPYEGMHDSVTSGLFVGDVTPDAINLRAILGRSGVQNAGSYSSGSGERDMTFDFDVLQDCDYKLQILLYKNYDDEATSMRIAVESPDNTVVDYLDLNASCTSSAGLLYTYYFTAADTTFTIYAGKRTDNGGTNSIVDIAAITVESLAPAYTVNDGTMTILDEVGDVDLAGNIVYAINCGQGLREENPTANPYLTGNGNDWGSSSDGQDLTVGEATFYCDMWSMKDEARAYNKVSNGGVTDFDMFGAFDDWRFLPERGSSNLGSDDGGILGFANYVSGWQTQNEKWQSPYENHHDSNIDGLFAGDPSTDAAYLKMILGCSGVLNAGSYGSGSGERDMTFDFDVLQDCYYKLQILLYKNTGEATNMRIAVESPDNTVVDYLDLNASCTSSSGLLYTYYFTAADTTFTIYAGKRTDNGGTNSIVDIAAITIESLSFAAAENPSADQENVDLNADLIWSPGEGALRHEVYLGIDETAVQNALPLRADLHYDAAVDLADLAVLSSSWLQTMIANADIDDSGQVDPGDLLMLADKWLTTGDGIFRAYLPLDTTTFDPGTFNADQTYFWRIDEINAAGKRTGDVWQFRTRTAFATDYYPLDGNALYTGQQLSWSAGVFAASHDVYLGTDENAVANADPDSDEFVRNQPETSYDPGTVNPDTVYYWRIDEVDAAIAAPYKGAVQSFSIGIDNSTLTGKVMAGYQMWFKTPDNTSTGGTDEFNHYDRDGSFAPGSCTIDYWPDMSEMDPDEKYLTTFVHADSSPAYVYNSEHPKTVDRHFKWMKDYGISGVFVQKFGADVSGEGLLLCRDIAPKYGRVFALMYDLSGNTVARLEDIKAEFKMLVDVEKLTESPAYLHHNGAPVIGIWGLGFNDGGVEREYNPGVESLLNFFKNDPVYGGNTVMVGVDNDWMTATIAGTPIKTLVENYCDIVSPWEVGRYSHDAGIESKRDNYWIPEMTWCNANGKFYLPVNWPGFSWFNMDPDHNVLDQVQRHGGQFMWKQFYEAINSGAQALYIAMFDEMDEGTAIFKCDPNPPVGASQFLNYYNDQGNLPSDEYLWLTGQGERMLRGEISLTETRPSR